MTCVSTSFHIIFYPIFQFISIFPFAPNDMDLVAQTGHGAATAKTHLPQAL